jgi:probable addiction module antidote protein
MPKRTGDFNAWHLEKLSDPTIAANYLNEVWENSRELFLDAVKDVIQARQVSSVAKKVGVQRESLYRSFSSAAGNPTWTTMQAVLCAVGLEFPGVRLVGGATPNLEPPRSAGTRKRRGRRKTSGTNYQQLSLPLSNITNIASSGAYTISVQQNYGSSLGASNIETEVAILPGFFLQQQADATAISGYGYAG